MCQRLEGNTPVVKMTWLLKRQRKTPVDDDRTCTFTFKFQDFNQWSPYKCIQHCTTCDNQGLHWSLPAGLLLLHGCDCLCSAVLTCCLLSDPNDGSWQTLQK
uniref:Uncharacterized protein n=2 Tax=Cacopsylla melanoneura TaxID=428564 RepID=A0A8D8MHL7_9HEMI